MKSTILFSKYLEIQRPYFKVSLLPWKKKKGDRPNMEYAANGKRMDIEQSMIKRKEIKRREMNRTERKGRKGTFWMTAAGIAACTLFFIYGISKGLFASQEAMASFLEGFGMLGPLVFVFIQIVQVVIPIMPGGISCLAGVLLFGPVWGFVYNYVGLCIGSACAFQIARRMGMPVVERVAGNQKIGKYLKWMENGTFDKLFALAIFFPAAPDDLLCFLAGVTKMRFGKFLLIILLGKPLSIALYSMGLQLIFQRVMGLIG